MKYLDDDCEIIESKIEAYYNSWAAIEFDSELEENFGIEEEEIDDQTACCLKLEEQLDLAQDAITKNYKKLNTNSHLQDAICELASYRLTYLAHSQFIDKAKTVLDIQAKVEAMKPYSKVEISKVDPYSDKDPVFETLIRVSDDENATMKSYAIGEGVDVIDLDDDNLFIVATM